MSLSYSKALELVKKFDGENIAVSDFVGSITRAMKASKDTMDDEFWIESISELCNWKGKSVL